MRKVTKQWTTRDGTRIRICDMTDAHLINTINMLKRAHVKETESAFAFAGMCRGDMATYYADGVAESMLHEESVHPLYDDLLADAERRGLV